MAKLKCSICGKELDTDELIDKCSKELEHHKLCFICNFWRAQHEADINVRGEHGYAIVNGEHYVLLPHTDGYFKGFGGRVFKFLFFDGTIVECDNVWYQGNINDAHPHWREIMPDNAKIIK